MALSKGAAALVTGAASGIGRAIALHLGIKGLDLSLVDLNEKGCEEVTQQVAKSGGGSSALFVEADVSVPGQLHAAFKRHVSEFGRLDVCVNNAGLPEIGSLLEDTSTDSYGAWHKTLDVNLSAIINGTRLAVQAMKKQGKGGAIVNIASAGGLYPFPGAHIYSTSKAGVVMFTRGMVDLGSQGIRVAALCPEFIDTPLLDAFGGKDNPQLNALISRVGGFVPMSSLLAGFDRILEDETCAGKCLWITPRKDQQWFKFQEAEYVDSP